MVFVHLGRNWFFIRRVLKSKSPVIRFLGEISYRYALATIQVQSDCLFPWGKTCSSSSQLAEVLHALGVAKKSIWDKQYKHQTILKQLRLRLTMKYLLKKNFNFQIFQISYISFYWYMYSIIKKNTCWYVIWPKNKNNSQLTWVSFVIKFNINLWF